MPPLSPWCLVVVMICRLWCWLARVRSALMAGTLHSIILLAIGWVWLGSGLDLQLLIGAPACPEEEEGDGSSISVNEYL